MGTIMVRRLKRDVLQQLPDKTRNKVMLRLRDNKQVRHSCLNAKWLVVYCATALLLLPDRAKGVSRA
jgi:hypothetical protein